MRTRTITRCLTTLATLTTAWGCGVGFDTAAQVEGLRVLGVQKSTPYAQPGGTVDFRMLYHDDTDEARDIQILWLRGCQNPPADSVRLCFEVFSEVLKGARDVPPPPRGEPSEEDLAELVTSLQAALEPEALAAAAGGDPELAAQAGMGAIPGFGTFEFGFGETFQLTVADDIISSRVPPKDPKLPPYGVEYVFGLACAGQLWIDTNADFPIGCFDESGERVESRRYVVGYSKLWVYDEFENTNPTILGVRVDGRRLADDEVCIDEACETLAPEDEEGIECPARRTIEACADEDDVQTRCPALPLEVVVDPDSVDDDPVLTSLEGARVSEQMWVNYYTDDGAFSQDLSLVNDGLAGFNEHPETEFLAPEEAGVARVWAVVHDNRGGVSWARFDLCVEE